MEQELKELKKKCTRCDNKALSKHRCPYQADINGDESKYCNCCSSCMSNCVDNI